MFTLTDYERKALSETINLADGHARYSSISIMKAMKNAIATFQTEAEKLNYYDLEMEFLYTFSKISNQSINNLEKTLICPTASISIEIIANFLRLNNYSVSLIHPTFDNLADILKRHKIKVNPLQEEDILNEDIDRLVSDTDTDCLFLVLPNNPTGQFLSQEKFVELSNACKKHNKLLIIDFCFRFFCPELYGWNQYEFLLHNDLNFIAIEDTGKTWATFEIKASTLTASKRKLSRYSIRFIKIFSCATLLFNCIFFKKYFP